jgi:hypothetical protein
MFGLSGCFNAPALTFKPAVIKSSVDTEVTDEEVNELIEILVANSGYARKQSKKNRIAIKTRKERYSSGGRYSSGHYYKDVDTIEYEFSYKNGKVFIKNKTDIDSDGVDYALVSQGYKNFLNKMATGEPVKEEIEQFSKFKPLYLKEVKQANKKFEEISIKIKDKTSVLPEKIQHQLQPLFKKSKDYISAVEAYKKHLTSENWKDLLKIKLSSNEFKTNYDDDSTTKVFDRYKIVSHRDKTNYSEESFPYLKIKDSLTFDVENVRYNYIPETFVSEDKNIKFTVSESAKKVTIENLSTNSIVINGISGYFNGGVDDNIFDTGSGINHRQNIHSINLSPKTKKSFTLGYIGTFDWRANLARNFIKNDGFVTVKSKDQKVNFGFSVNYTVNSTTVKNLYRVNDYSISDF